MSSFEDLLSMRTRAFLIKDIDPEILQRMLGTRSLATELNESQLQIYYKNKVPIPDNAESMLHLMDRGGGLNRDWDHPLYADRLEGIEHEDIRSWIEELAKQGLVTKIRGTGMSELDDKWFSTYMAEIHGTLGCLAMNGGKEAKDLRDIYTQNLTFQIGKSFDGTTVTDWFEQPIIDPHESLRVKIIEMLGSEGPLTSEIFEARLPLPKPQIEKILYELEMRNVISVGFFRQTEEAEYILKIDEHKITGGEEEVVEYRRIQNLVLEKSFTIYPDAYSAFNEHILFQKQQELLYRVKDFRFSDWVDLQLDSDVLMGRLLHNRIGYSTLQNLPMLLGLKPKPWLGEMEKLLLEKLPHDENLTRQEWIADFPRGEEYKSLQRDVKNAISNLERQLCVVKQFEDVVGRRRRLSLFHRVIDEYEPLSFKDSLFDVIRRSGPIRAFTLRYYVSRSVEELALALSELESEGKIKKVMALVPEPEPFYVVPEELPYLNRQTREDRTLRILTQSDPYVSRFIWEIRSILDRGWYLPVFKGVDPIGKVLMFKVNDYLEIKDLHIPHAYLDEFCKSFELLLDNHSDQLIDVAILSNVNGDPISDLDDDTINALEQIGFTKTGERMIRGGVVDPQPREIAERALFYEHHLHQDSRLENEIKALEKVNEIRDDFGLRGRAEIFRVGLKNMASAHLLQQGINLRGHQVWASYEHFATLLAIRGEEAPEDLLDVCDYFTNNSDPNLFMERHAMKRGEFRKLIQPLIRLGHMVQDFRGGFRTVIPNRKMDRMELRREYLRDLVSSFPIITIKQFIKLAGTPFKPEELKHILTEFEEDGTLIKGFLIQDFHEVCWGKKDMLENAKNIKPIRDFVLPPSDPIAPYFADVLKQKFGFGSAYLVFRNAEPIAAFKANTRNKTIEITDYEGSESGWRVVKEFAWEHQMPLKSEVRIAGKKLK